MMKDCWSVICEAFREYEMPIMGWLILMLTLIVITHVEMESPLRWLLLFMIPTCYFGSAMEFLDERYRRKTEVLSAEIDRLLREKQKQ